MSRPEIRKLPTARSRARREELLAAARTTFEELGYFDTTVAEIARRAEASHGTFYSYFESKDDVLRVLVSTLVDDLYGASTQPVGTHATPFLTLEATIRQFMSAYRQRAPLIRILEQATWVSDDFLGVRLDIRARFATGLEAVIRDQQRRRADPDRLDPAVTAYALGGMVEDLARGRYILGQPLDEETAIATMAVMWARTLGIPVDRQLRRRRSS